MINEYRCTRPNIYKGNCLGNTDPLTRQGYYVDAEDEEGAHRAMRKQFPHDSHFEVRVCKSPSPRHAVPAPCDHDTDHGYCGSCGSPQGDEKDMLEGEIEDQLNQGYDG